MPKHRARALAKSASAALAKMAEISARLIFNLLLLFSGKICFGYTCKGGCNIRSSVFILLFPFGKAQLVSHLRHKVGLGELTSKCMAGGAFGSLDFVFSGGWVRQ